MEKTERVIQIFDETGRELLSSDQIEKCITVKDLRIKCEEQLKQQIKIIYDGSALNDKIEILSFFHSAKKYQLIAKNIEQSYANTYRQYYELLQNNISPYVTMKLFGLLLLIYTDNVEIAMFFSLVYILAFISYKSTYVLDTYSNNIFTSAFKVVIAFICSVFIINFEMKIK